MHDVGERVGFQRLHLPRPRPGRAGRTPPPGRRSGCRSLSARTGGRSPPAPDRLTGPRRGVNTSNDTGRMSPVSMIPGTGSPRRAVRAVADDRPEIGIRPVEAVAGVRHVRGAVAADLGSAGVRPVRAAESVSLLTCPDPAGVRPVQAPKSVSLPTRPVSAGVRPVPAVARCRCTPRPSRYRHSAGAASCRSASCSCGADRMPANQVSAAAARQDGGVDRS